MKLPVHHQLQMLNMMNVPVEKRSTSLLSGKFTQCKPHLNVFYLHYLARVTTWINLMNTRDSRIAAVKKMKKIPVDRAIKFIASIEGNSNYTAVTNHF